MHGIAQHKCIGTGIDLLVFVSAVFQTPIHPRQELNQSWIACSITRDGELRLVASLLQSLHCQLLELLHQELPAVGHFCVRINKQ